MFAAASGNCELIKVLNVTDDKGRTPIHIIAQKGFGKNQVQLLIEHGGDINIRDVDGKIPLDYARKAKKKVVENFLMEYANRAQKET